MTTGISWIDNVAENLDIGKTLRTGVNIFEHFRARDLRKRAADYTPPGVRQGAQALANAGRLIQDAGDPTSKEFQNRARPLKEEFLRNFLTTLNRSRKLGSSAITTRGSRGSTGLRTPMRGYGDQDASREITRAAANQTYNTNTAVQKQMAAAANSYIQQAQAAQQQAGVESKAREASELGSSQASQSNADIARGIIQMIFPEEKGEAGKPSSKSDGAKDVFSALFTQALNQPQRQPVGNSANLFGSVFAPGQTGAGSPYNPDWWSIRE